MLEVHALTPELCERLRANKLEILSVLTTPETPGTAIRPPAEHVAQDHELTTEELEQAERHSGTAMAETDVKPTDQD